MNRFTEDEDDFDKVFLVQQQVYNLKQGDKETEVQYLKQVEALNEKSPDSLQAEVARHTLRGLKDVDLQYRVQNHLLQARKIDLQGQLVPDIKFKDIRSVFIAATRLIGKPDPFAEQDVDKDDDQQDVTQQQLNLKILKVLKRIEHTAAITPAATSQPLLPYITKPPNPFTPNQQCLLYPGNTGKLNLTYYNCMGVGHTSNVCQADRISDTEYATNRQKVKVVRGH
jgi:hypothetical protein